MSQNCLTIFYWSLHPGQYRITDVIKSHVLIFWNTRTCSSNYRDYQCMISISNSTASKPQIKWAGKQRAWFKVPCSQERSLLFLWVKSGVPSSLQKLNTILQTGLPAASWVSVIHREISWFIWNFHRQFTTWVKAGKYNTSWNNNSNI